MKIRSISFARPFCAHQLAVQTMASLLGTVSLFATIDVSRAESAGDESTADLREIGSLQYRCGDGSFSEPIAVVAPFNTISPICANPSPDTKALDDFVIDAGNTYTAPGATKRPLRFGEKQCRHHGGLGYLRHKVNRAQLADLLQRCRKD